MRVFRPTHTWIRNKAQYEFVEHCAIMHDDGDVWHPGISYRTILGTLCVMSHDRWAKEFVPIIKEDLQ